jgi:hypothetical protein
VVYQDIVNRVKEQAMATAAGARIAQVSCSLAYNEKTWVCIAHIRVFGEGSAGAGTCARAPNCRAGHPRKGHPSTPSTGALCLLHQKPGFSSAVAAVAAEDGACSVCRRHGDACKGLAGDAHMCGCEQNDLISRMSAAMTESVLRAQKLEAAEALVSELVAAHRDSEVRTFASGDNRTAYEFQ